MSNVLTEEKKQQVLVLGRMGWSLGQIQRRTGVRRETAARYLKSVGIAVRELGGWGAQGSVRSKTGHRGDPDFGAELPHAERSPSASACEPWREWIEAQVAAGTRDARSLVAIPEQLAKRARLTFPKDAFGKARPW